MAHSINLCCFRHNMKLFPKKDIKLISWNPHLVFCFIHQSCSDRSRCRFGAFCVLLFQRKLFYESHKEGKRQRGRNWRRKIKALLLLLCCPFFQMTKVENSFKRLAPDSHHKPTVYELSFRFKCETSARTFSSSFSTKCSTLVSSCNRWNNDGICADEEVLEQQRHFY